MIVISTGCPAGIGPEVSLLGALASRQPCVLVGDFGTLVDAARVVGIDERKLEPFAGFVRRGKLHVYHVGPSLAPTDRRPGRPSKRAGAAQLEYVARAMELVKAERGRALVTAPVSKEAIARSGARGAARFRGHTEYLAARDGAASAVMCFESSRLSTSLVTTHLPLSKVPRSLEPRLVSDAIVALARLKLALGAPRPHLAICSLNPHAGEGELLGTEERRAIVPGMKLAKRVLGGRLTLTGPLGAETAYRKALAGAFDGVVAMYHDQATIPMKLVAFGDAVNVTHGLSFVRTSVDHGTGYDIAWQGTADPRGMKSAIALAARLL
jgi:4-hydroxythreonine-4-phosphate dehydrogenase